MNSTSTSPGSQMLTAIKTIVGDGDTVELRIPDADGAGTVSGYFNDLTEMTRAVFRYDGKAPGIYFTLNPVDPTLLARSTNRVKQYVKKGGTTSDPDIVHRRWVLVDIDPVRPTGICSTDEEHEAAQVKATDVVTYLTELGFPAPLVMDSGNGAYVLISVDLPNDDASRDLVRDVLKALAERFNDAGTKIDTGVFNSARIMRVPLTTNRKGDPTADRPHRKVRQLQVPTERGVASVDLLRTLLPAGSVGIAATGSDDPVDKMTRWLARYGLSVTKHGPWGNGKYRWELAVCPFNPDHDKGEAWVAVYPSGAKAAGCHHNSCTWKWKELRNEFDPRQPGTPSTGMFTDARMAETIAEEVLQDRFMWVGGIGWMSWDGRSWKGDPGTEVAALEAIRVYCKDRFVAVLEAFKNDPTLKEVVGGWHTLLSAAREATLLKVGRGLVSHRIAELDADLDLLNTPNGIVDLRTGKLSPSDPNALMTKVTSVAYRPGATHSDWTQALSALPLDRQEFLRVRIGQGFSGHPTPDDALLISQGSGSNGKTTIFLGISKAAGDYHLLMSRRVLLANPDAHPTELMDLRGARLAMMEETAEAQRLDTNRMKNILGTPDITARHIREDDITFPITHTLFVSTNYKPIVLETDDGTWRRLALLLFKSTYRNPGDEGYQPGDLPKDQLLRERVRTDPAVQEAVLAWAIEGARRWYANGKVMPQLLASVVDDTRAWRRESDLVLGFLDDEMEFDPSRHVMASDVVTSFNRWLADQSVSAWTREKVAAQFGKHDALRTRRISKQFRRRHESLSRPAEAYGSVPVKYRAWNGLRFREGGDGASDDLRREADKTDMARSEGVLQDHVLGVSTQEVHPLKEFSSRGHTSGSRHSRHSNVATKIPAQTGVNSAPLPNPINTGANHVPGSRVAFDLESASVDTLWSYGPHFIRLAGYRTGGHDTVLTTDLDELLTVIHDSELVIGHNIMGFDLLALARYHGLDIHELVRRDAVIDTKLVAFLADPPPSRLNAGQSEKLYSLESVGTQLLGTGKTGDLKALANEFGGYDAIPVDDPRYVTYLHGDVDITDRLFDLFTPISDYAKREHRVAAIAAQTSLNGFRVDLPLLEERRSGVVARRAEHIRKLQEEYGLPTHTKDGKKEAKSPQTMKAGREAIKKAFEDLGAPHMPQTQPDSGVWATSGDAMDKMMAQYGHLPGVTELAGVVKALAGERSIYETITANLVGDRVHPAVSLRQVSGRWSVTKPGMTVLGKRDGRVAERAVFLPEPGHVILTVDLSQIDARAIAAWSQDEAYLALFEPGMDSHAEIAEMVWGDQSRREQAKPLSHGWNYGMGIPKLMSTAHVSQEVATQFDDTMRERFPRLVEWQNEIRDAADSGALLDNGFGRMMRPDLSRVWTQAPSLLGQGTARDLMMEGLLRLPPELLPMLRVQVHDEIVLSVPVADAIEVEQEVVRAMSFQWAPPDLSIPVQVVAKPGATWGINWAGAYDE